MITQTRRRPTLQLGELFEKQPPSSVHAEIAVLGCMIMNSSVIEDVAAIIRSAEDFYKPEHGLLYAELVALSRETTGKIDLVQINQRLADKRILEAIGGLSYLADLADGTPFADEGVRYAAMVRDKACLRELIVAAGESIQNAYSGEMTAAQVVDDAQSRINQVDGHRSSDDFVSVGELMRQAEADIEARAEGKASAAMPTGFASIDGQLDEGGLMPGDMVVVGARPSIGKSVFLLNIALNMARAGIPVAYFSLEMGHLQNAKRILARDSGVRTNDMRDPQSMSREQWSDIQRTVAGAQDLPLYMFAASAMNASRFRSLCRRGVSRKGVKVAFLDYLQLIDGGGKSDNRQEQVSEFSRMFKQTAMDLQIASVAASQVNRKANDTTNPGMPALHNLRESGSIEQDADIVFMLHRDDYYTHQQDPDAMWSNTIDVAIAKQREGATGIFPMHFDGARRRIGDIERRQW